MEGRKEGSQPAKQAGKDGGTSGYAAIDPRNLVKSRHTESSGLNKLAGKCAAKICSLPLKENLISHVKN